MDVALDSGLARRLLRYLVPYKLQLVIAVAPHGCYSAIVPAFPSLIAIAVDRYIVAATMPWAALGLDERLDGLTVIVLVYLGLRILNFFLRYGYTYLVAWIGQHVIYDLRRDTFGKIQRLHLGFFDRTPVGRLITRITSDVEAIQTAMTDGVVGLIADVGLIVGLTIYMFTINWQLALVALIVMPLLFVTLNYLRLRIRDAFRAVRLRTSRSNAYLAENLGGMTTVQLFNREHRNAKRFDELNLHLLDAYVEQVRWFSLFWPSVNFFGAVATALLLYFAAYQLVGPGVGEAVTIGVLIAFLQYTQMFFRPLQELSERFNVLQAAMASAERIFSLIDTPEGINDRPDPYRSRSASAARSASRTSTSPTTARTGCCAASTSPSSRASRSPSWATPAPARRPSSAS
jgi:ATP-binding cassette, subfamily B, multidrug efflux pump